MKVINVDLSNKLKKFYGLPPYDIPGNYVQYDGYFSASIVKDFGIDAVNEELKRMGKEVWKK